MPKSRSLVVVLLVVLWAISGCGEDNDTPTEPANHSEFYVENASSVEFEVHTETNTTYPLTNVVAPGETVRLSIMAGGTYTEFTPPSAALIEVELRSVDSGTVLYRQRPVEDASWESVHGAVRVTAYTLVIRDADLD